MLTHQKTKPFVCIQQGCSKSYCDYRSLRRHHEVQHGLCILREAPVDDDACGEPPHAHEVPGGPRALAPPEARSPSSLLPNRDLLRCIVSSIVHQKVPSPGPTPAGPSDGEGRSTACPCPPSSGTPVHSRPASCPRGTAVRPGALDICRPEPGGRGPPLHRASHPEPPLPLTSGAGSNLACLLGHMQRDTHLYTCTRMHTHHSEGPRPGKSKHLLQGKQQARLPREKMWPNQTQAACGPRSRCYPRVTMASRVWW